MNCIKIGPYEYFTEDSSLCGRLIKIFSPYYEIEVFELNTLDGFDFNNILWHVQYTDGVLVSCTPAGYLLTVPWKDIKVINDNNVHIQVTASSEEIALSKATRLMLEVN